jgi:hypothetical protein
VTSALRIQFMKFVQGGYTLDLEVLKKRAVGPDIVHNNVFI